MNIFLEIFLTFAIVYGGYMIFCAVMSYLGARELERAGVDPDGGDIEIIADVGTLEYLIRCASWVTTFERRKIVVVIDESRRDAVDATYIVKAMSRRVKNLYYRRT